MKPVQALALVMALVPAAVAMAQEPSLGDAARREKARRVQHVNKAGRVYTNDDLEALRTAGESRGNLNIMEGGQAEPGQSAGPSEGPKGTGAEGAQEAPGASGEAQWRTRADGARAAIEAAQSELAAQRQAADRLRAQLSAMAQPYVEDTNERLRLTAELNAAEAAATRAQEQLAEARARYQELLQEAQRQRIPAAWISNAS
jgi:hypothetical protein